MHDVVSKVQEVEHFNVPVQPVPSTSAQVFPPNFGPSKAIFPGFDPAE